jgi:hypothetical protein
MEDHRSPEDHTSPDDYKSLEDYKKHIHKTIRPWRRKEGDKEVRKSA